MNIREATAAALAVGIAMRRTTDTGEVWIKPTNGPNCCVVGFEDKEPSPRWNPSAEDLMAKDWDLIMEAEK